MDMFEEAEAIRSTMQLCHLTQSELAKQLGVSQSYVANKLRLLGFSEEMTEKIKESGISERHARSLLRLRDEGEMQCVLSSVIERGLTVRECEAMVDSLVMRGLPSRIGRGDILRSVDDFKAALTGGCEVLRSLGVNAKIRTSYLGEDMYISIILRSV